MKIILKKSSYYIPLPGYKHKFGFAKSTKTIRDDEKVLVNVDYDKEGRAIGIEIIKW